MTVSKSRHTLNLIEFTSLYKGQNKYIWSKFEINLVSSFFHHSYDWLSILFKALKTPKRVENLFLKPKMTRFGCQRKRLKRLSVFKATNIIQVSARFWKILQDSARFYKLLHDSAKFCKILQYFVQFCTIFQDSNGFSKILQHSS